MIDTHIHCDSRSSEDFERMYLAGINTAITCGFYPYNIYNENVLLNHLERILEYDTVRAEKYGLNIKVALGIHPSNTNINPDSIYEKLYKWIDEKKIIAIGEIGLEKLTQSEITIFKKQLEIAENTKTKVIIHTPRKNKKEVLKEIKKIVLETINPNLVIIDHINSSVIENVINEKFTLGLTVQPEKMEVKEAIDIISKYGFDRFLLNSDISNMPSDPLSVPKTVRTLTKLGYKEKDIKKVASLNGKKFFKI